MEFNINKHCNNEIFNEYDKAIFDLYLNSGEDKVLISEYDDFKLMKIEAVKRIYIFDYFRCVQKELDSCELFHSIPYPHITNAKITEYYIDWVLSKKIERVEKEIAESMRLFGITREQADEYETMSKTDRIAYYKELKHGQYKAKYRYDDNVIQDRTRNTIISTSSICDIS